MPPCFVPQQNLCRSLQESYMDCVQAPEGETFFTPFLLKCSCVWGKPANLKSVIVVHPNFILVAVGVQENGEPQQGRGGVGLLQHVLLTFGLRRAARGPGRRRGWALPPFLSSPASKRRIRLEKINKYHHLKPVHNYNCGTLIFPTYITWGKAQGLPHANKDDRITNENSLSPKKTNRVFWGAQIEPNLERHIIEE